MFKRLVILFLGTLLVASCHESFNTIYEDVVENDPNVFPSEEVDTRKVNILPTLSDPLYFINNETTRGPYGTYEEDRDHWLSSRFQCFGLRTGNIMGGGADYKAAMEGNKDCAVLWNQSLGLHDQHGHTYFYDEDGKMVDCKYNVTDNLHRYKFFLLGMDGKEVDFQVEDGNRLFTRVQLDGSNDILHSFAYHTDEQYADAVEQLPASDASKIFLEGGQDFLYNRLSGYLGMHPIFNMNHLMSRFDIYVKGAIADETPRCDFLKMIITDVSIKAYNNVDIIVADDSWERDTYIKQFNDNALVRPVGEPAMCTMPLRPNEMRNTEFTETYWSELNFDTLAAEAEQLSQTLGVPVIPDGSHWMSTSKLDTLTQTVMMPPLPTENGQFAISFKYRYLFTHIDPDTKKHHLGINPQVDMPGGIWEDLEAIVHIPTVDTGGYPVVYRGGKRYSLIITVYGKSKIRVDVIQAMQWQDGGDIEVEGGV